MTFINTDILCCPLDQLPLRQQGNGMGCENGHRFDIARQGYINLLSAGDKRSKDPGDGGDMVVARREFLEGGHYEPIADKLAELVTPLLADVPVIVDAGCGEGYYLEYLVQQIASCSRAEPTVVGFDISKWAVQAATRRLPATWMVASNRNIPIADHCVDLLLSLFGFPAYDSFLRVLKPSGVLLLASAGPRHLLELREVIYPTVKISESRELQQAQAGGFSLVETITLQYTTAPLSQGEIGQLLGMTPHLFRASREGKERAALLDNFSVSVDVHFHLLR